MDNDLTQKIAVSTDFRQKIYQALLNGSISIATVDTP